MVRSDDLSTRTRDSYRYITEPTTPQTWLGRVMRSIRRVLVGRPLESSQAAHQHLSKIQALAVFSSDALSSTAYATEEILLVLVLAGSAAYNYVIPIGIAIAGLLAIVVFSYRQTVHAYPQGGGSYIVTKDNLGRSPSLLAASSLMTDYILTVAVSISAGVAAITSAFTGTRPYAVEIAVVAIVLIMVANLRGLQESGRIFAIPTYLFIGSMVVLIVLGFAGWLGIGVTPHHVVDTIPPATRGLTIFLILRAFASGCAALTGVEAISDGVPAFKEPRDQNAAKTLVAMGLILGSMFLGVTFLSQHYHLVPVENQTLVSQLARVVVGTSPFYYFVQAATAAILLLAANTSFADFPRLAYFLARDRFLPRQFTLRGDRLAYSTGIAVLAIASSALVIFFGANVSHLIPLYAVGVFISFTLSQASMTYRWWRAKAGQRNNLAMFINGLGALTTGVVAIIIIATKFVGGAWIILLLLPFIIVNLLGIRRHYDSVANQLRLSIDQIRNRPVTWTRDSATIVALDKLNRAAIRAVDYAQTVSGDITVVHVAEEGDEANEMREKWDKAGIQLPLVIIESPYREVLGPLVNYIEELHRSKGGGTLTVILPEFVPAHWYENFLHNQTAWRLRAALWSHPGIAVTSVPYHLKR
ncbi:MAG TPA: APC family permease [Nitrolancea sp.]